MNLINSVLQTATMTFAFSSVFVLFLWQMFTATPFSLAAWAAGRPSTVDAAWSTAGPPWPRQRRQPPDPWRTCRQPRPRGTRRPPRHCWWRRWPPTTHPATRTGAGAVSWVPAPCCTERTPREVISIIIIIIIIIVQPQPPLAASSRGQRRTSTGKH